MSVMQLEASALGLLRPEVRCLRCTHSAPSYQNPTTRASGLAHRRLLASNCRQAPVQSGASCSAAEERAAAVCSSSEVASSSTSSSEAASLNWLPLLCSSPALLSLVALPAQASADVPQLTEGGFSKSSYYVTLGLFLLSVPGADLVLLCLHIRDCMA